MLGQLAFTAWLPNKNVPIPTVAFEQFLVTAGEDADMVSQAIETQYCEWETLLGGITPDATD